MFSIILAALILMISITVVLMVTFEIDVVGIFKMAIEKISTLLKVKSGCTDAQSIYHMPTRLELENEAKYDWTQQFKELCEQTQGPIPTYIDDPVEEAAAEAREISWLETKIKSLQEEIIDLGVHARWQAVEECDRLVRRLDDILLEEANQEFEREFDAKYLTTGNLSANLIVSKEIAPVYRRKINEFQQAQYRRTRPDPSYRNRY